MKTFVSVASRDMTQSTSFQAPRSSTRTGKGGRQMHVSLKRSTWNSTQLFKIAKAMTGGQATTKKVQKPYWIISSAMSSRQIGLKVSRANWRSISAASSGHTAACTSASLRSSRSWFAVHQRRRRSGAVDDAAGGGGALFRRPQIQR